jgi:hypothetical protein
MSFKLTDKKIKSKHPIAKVRGGEKDGWFLYLDDFKYSIKDIPKKMYEDMKEKEIEELEKALHTGYEPANEDLTKLFYEFKEYIKKKNCKIVLREKGKFEYIPSLEKIERVIICGISGSGKSTWASRYIYNWKKQHGGNSKKARPFFIVSNLDEDEVLDKFEPERLDIEDIAYEGVDIDEITDSIMLIDDIDTIEDSKIRKGVRSFVNNMLEISRHYKTYLLITSHQIQNYQQTRTQLNEATNVVLFPHNNARAVNNYLRTYEYMTPDQISRILNIKSRWIMLCKWYKPAFILTENQAYII